MGEIAGKLNDAAGMFWQSLDDRERRLLLIGGLYFAFSVYSMVAAKQREWQHEELVDEVLEKIEARRVR